MAWLKRTAIGLGMLAGGLVALNLITRQFLPGVRSWLGLSA